MSVASEFAPVFVTGGAGFVGSRIVRSLVERGDDVHVAVRPGSPTWRLSGVEGRCEIYDLDILDARAVDELFDNVSPRVVIHAAAHGAYERQSDSRRILETNVLGTLNLLQSATRYGARLFVNAGSSSEYGFKVEPMRETDRLEPNSVYSVAKSAQSHLCSYAGKRGEMAVAVLRLFSVYGPHEEPSRLIPTLIRRIELGLPLAMTAPNTVRDFVYVDDVVAAMTDFARLARLKGDLVNLGSGVETTLREVVSTLFELMERSVDVSWGAMRPRLWDANRWVADPSRAREVLGWTACRTLREGLAETIAWMQTEGRDTTAHDQRVA